MKKSRLLVSLMVIGLVAALIGGATMAWFTDSDETAPVTFTAGTLMIDMDEPALTEEFADFNLDKLNPGDTWEWEFDVRNEGTKSLNWGIYACWKDTIGQENTDMGEDMLAMLADKGYGTGELSDVLVWQVFADYGAGEVELTNGILPEEGPVAAYMKALASGADAVHIRIKATLPGEADNAYQGSKMDLAFGVMAWQTTNDAPAPTLNDIVCPFASPAPGEN